MLPKAVFFISTAAVFIMIIAAFVLFNLSILHPTGVVAYSCYNSTCYTDSVESKLGTLYFFGAIIPGAIAWVSGLIVHDAKSSRDW